MFAIELYLEETSANLIRAMWQKFAAGGITSSILDNGCQPHVTLGVFEDLEVEATIRQLDSFFKVVEVPVVTFEVLGCFPATGAVTPTLALGPSRPTSVDRFSFYRASFQPLFWQQSVWR